MPLKQSTVSISSQTPDKSSAGVVVPSRRYVYLTLCLVALIGLAVNFKLEQIDLDLALREEREKTLNETSLLASRLQSETNSTFYLIVGLARLIEINGGITEARFNDICEELILSRPGLLNIAAAPDMVIRFVYPLEGNEGVMGLDYAKLPNQKEAAFRVKKTGKPVIAGPIRLVQGGEAAVGRFPVYVSDPETGEREFWGLISTPFDVSVLYSEVGLLDPSLGLEVSLRGRDALGAEGEVFFGSPEIEAKNPVYFTIELLSGTWQMAALPKGGWMQAAPNAWLIRPITATVTLLIGLLIWLFYQHSLKKKRAQEAEQAILKNQERFYANMSHELRTPLNGIFGFSDIIGHSTDDPEIQGFAKDIMNSADTLTRLLDDVLHLSRDDIAEVRYGSFALEPFFSELLPPLIREAESKGVAFIREPLPPECARIRSNEPMLRQVLWNLLSNAVKFTEAGSVTLRVAVPEAGTIAYHIIDTGIGIEPEHLKKIFQDFVQEDNSNTRNYGGAGLGLAIVQRFVVRLGGTVTVTSEKGQGSEFTVILPAPPEPEQK